MNRYKARYKTGSDKEFQWFFIREEVERKALWLKNLMIRIREKTSIGSCNL
jgi:hypothetical protein